MSSTFTVYATINALEEFGFIAGSTFQLVFNVFDAGGSPQNIGGANVKWTLTPFGQNYNILQVNGSLIDDFSFKVDILPSHTLNLSGKYIQQAVVHSFYGQTYIPAQGVILIAPKTPEV